MDGVAEGRPGGPASTLFYNTRRVGVDLKAVAGGLGAAESLRLEPPDSQGNQAVNVAITLGEGVGAVPYEVDFKNGRVYVDSRYEGLPFRVQYTATQNPPATNRTGAVEGELGWINEPRVRRWSRCSVP
jgi:hypothetical protein